MAQHSDMEPLRSGGGGAAALPPSSSVDPDSPSTPRRSRVRELLRNLDRRLSSRGRHHYYNGEGGRGGGGAASPRGGEPGLARGGQEDSDELGDGAPPEWALLLVGCLLGLATGICVAAFNRGVHVIHEWAWAGTPTEGAAWLRLQRLADTWHRILLIPVTGGVVVGMMHGLLEIFEQIKQSLSSQREGVDFMAAIFPTIKAIQAAITLGTGCSLGPEGPSVDIGKSCAYGCAEMMENNRERRIALVAAGSAAGIASGFNAAVAGCFFAIETVLRPLRAENSPPFTTAMIILASVISSTVSNVLLGEKAAFIVPTYELKSAAELPLYLILGMLCGVVSVAFRQLVVWFTKTFDLIRKKFSLPAVVCPALGGLGAGLIALRYPGILYWGFTNVDEILHTGKSASAPGIWLLAQLAAAKVVATALCKGSGLVGGLYAPSLMIGAAVGAVFGGSAAELINSAIPGNTAVAHPQAYALGAVGLAIWVPSVVNQSGNKETFEATSPRHGYSSLLPPADRSETDWRRPEGDDVELAILEDDPYRYGINNEETLLDDLKVSQAMSKHFIKVTPTVNIKEATRLMHDKQQSCVLVVDTEDFLEGIVTIGDIRRKGFEFDLSEDTPRTGENSSNLDVNSSLVSSCLTRGFQYHGNERGLVTCFPDTDLSTAKVLMEVKGIKQLPVVKRRAGRRNDGRRKVLGLLHYDSIGWCLREELERWKAIYQRENFQQPAVNGH
uniref:Chloride channel protein n=1 Tax=Leersia perrieri TaxID=77586 RepID=A0A0D9X9D1_9ORYZ